MNNNELESNLDYQKLLQKYHDLNEKMENLDNDRSLFEFEIILDSGTTIYPNRSSAYFKLKDEIHNTLEQIENLKKNRK